MYKSKSLQLFIAITVAIFTTGFLRLQLFSGVPESDGGFYTFCSQYIYYALTHGQDLNIMTLSLYQFMTAWVYGFEVNQYILLRLIDGLVAIAASVVFFKVILKESGSTLFTVILTSVLFILMNNVDVILFGFRNSIWAAYIPLFSALLIWQNANKEDTYSFYLIGGLVSLGVLLREPFLPSFLLAGISILIGYGWRVLIKYLIGSAIVGFSVLAVLLMFRGWDLFDLINSYTDYSSLANTRGKAGISALYLASIKTNYFVYITASLSIIYIIKLYFTGKDSFNINRGFFWLALALVALIEPMFKIGWAYSYAQCLPGLAGLTAMGWKYMMNQASEKINILMIMGVGLMSLFVILPTIDRTLIKSSYIFSPRDAIQWAKEDVFRMPEMIERSQYLVVAAKIYGYSRNDSTLATSGLMSVLYPITGLLPASYESHDLGKLFVRLNYDENKLMGVLEKSRPTLIIISGAGYSYEKNLPKVIEKTNLYNKIEIVKGNQNITYGWKFKQPGIIYRLKNFK